jgi:DNA-binding NtrC family response regulator
VSADSKTATVLLLDDDPQHLKLYQLLIEKGPFKAVPVLIGARDGWTLPEDQPDAITLDYRLKGRLAAVEVAEWLKTKYPETPIVVLSDMEWLPDEMRGYASHFVKKGQPEMLMETLMNVTAHARNATQE